MAYRKAYNNHVEKLVKCLPMDDTHFITTLSAQKLFPGDTENKIIKFSTQAEKASYFLSHVIKPALDIDDTSDFEKLLTIMHNCGYNHVEKLAGTIIFEIDNSDETNSHVLGISLFTPAKRKRSRIDSEDFVDLDKLKDEDVFRAYSYLLSRIENLFEKIHFTKLQSVCMLRGVPLPQEFIQHINEARNLNDILTLFNNTIYCNLFNVRLLKTIANNIDGEQIQEAIKIYEDHVYSSKISVVDKYFSLWVGDKKTVSMIEVEINTSHKDSTVKQIIDCCGGLERIMKMYAGAISAINSRPGCLKITVVIPLHCSLHAFEMAKKNFIKLRQFHIQYLEIESFPKVFAFNYCDNENALTVLSSSVPKFSDPNEVIKHYYTYLESHMDADSVSHMMHYKHLITDDDYEAITAAPNDSKMNTVILQYIKAMDMSQLIRLCDILKSIETQKIIGDHLSTSLENSSSMNKKYQMFSMDVNLLFLDLIDKLVTQMSTADVAILTNKCGALLASDVHQIPLFARDFIHKLINSTYPFIFRIYLLPYVSWFDCSILKQLVIFSNSKEAVKMVDQFLDSLDYSKPITSYPIPEFSQMMIPLDDSQYTLLATKHIRSSNELILQDVVTIKRFLIHILEITDHAIQLIAIHSKYCCFYWLLPNQIRTLVEDKLSQIQLELWDEGIVLTTLFPVNFCSDENVLQRNMNPLFNFCNTNLEDPMEILTAKYVSFMNHQVNVNYQELTTIKRQKEELKYKVEETESQKTQLSNKISEHQSDLKMKKTIIEAQKNHLKSIRKKLKEKKQKMEEIEKENEQLTVENNKHKSEINELTKSLKSLTTNQQELMQKITMEPAEVLKEFSVKLLSLPVRDSKFIALLEEQDLLPGDTKDKIAAINLTQADAAQLLLGKIKNSLSITHNGFDKLVLVMKQYKDGGMEELANQMESYVIKSNPSGRQVLKITFEEIFINQLSTDISDLKTIIYNFFLDNFGKSSGIPVFVLEIMAQKSESDLFQLLKSKTPYCDIFNFLDFIENITNKISNEEVKKIVSCSKEALHCKKLDDILPYIDKEHIEKEGFSKVVLQMTKNFKLYTGEGIHRHKKITSVILKLQHLVCFGGFNEETQTFTYLIPSILIERACNSAKQVADQCYIDDILQITIEQQKILNEQYDNIQSSLHSSMKIKVFICLKNRAISIEVDVKLSNSIEVVKWMIYRILYIPPHMQVLRYDEKNLENDKTVQYYKIEISSTIYLTPKVEKIYHDVIPILPSNCQSIVGELDQEINKIFRALSRKHYNHFDLYMHLLPYVYEKCDYHVLHFIDVLMNAIKDHTKRRKLWELKTDMSQLKDTSVGTGIDSSEVKEDTKSSTMPPEKEDNKGELEQPDNIVSENQQNAIEPNATEPHFTENEGVQQGIQFLDNSDITDIQSLTASIHQNTLSSPVFKYPVLQPPDLPFNLVHRQEPLDAIVTKLCINTINQNAHNKVFAVTGVGGFGKTTIVVTLCHDRRVQKQFTGGVLFIELGPQAPDPKVKLNEIYFSIVGKPLENNNNVEFEIGKIFKDNFQDFLVIIDDVCDAEDVKPIIAAFTRCHVVFTTRRNDIAQKLAVGENIVSVGPMKLDEAVTLLTDDLLRLNKISGDDKELLKELAQDAHMWPVLLCLVRGQLNHHLKLNIHVNKAINNVQHKLHGRGLTAFDKVDIESASKIHKSVSIYIESTLELLPEVALNRFITLILFTGIGGIFSKAALPNLWNISDLEAKKVVKMLSDYGLVSFKNIATSQHLQNQMVVHTHSVISQYMFDNVRSDQVATLSPFGLFCTKESVGGKLESLFRNSYLQHDLKLSQLTPREYLTYTMLKIEHVIIPFQLKRITAHILHDPHIILLMLQRIHNTIRKSVSHLQIITKFSEQMVVIDTKCKKALKDAQVLNRIINSDIQHFLFMRDYDKLEKILEEWCAAFSNEIITQDCIELINQIIPMCEVSILDNFDFIRQMLETMTPQYHFITMEKLPIIKLYIGLHRDIVSSLKKGSTELYKMYTDTNSGDFIKKLESVSSKYLSKLKEIAPLVSQDY